MAFLVIGFMAGLFGGLVGLGGGVIIIAVMVRLYKFSQHQAHGTSLVALVFTGISGAVTYYLNGSVDIMAVACLAASAIFTAHFGAIYANVLPEWRLRKAFGLFLIIVSLLLISKPYLTQASFLSHPLTGWARIAVLLASGAVAGFLSGMMGIGGGTIMVPALVLFGGLSQYLAQGSSLAVMIPTSTVGAYTHWRLGNVVAKVLLGLIPGILLGTFLGGNLAHLLTEANLRLVFAAVLIGLGICDIRDSTRQKLLAEKS